MTNKMHDFQYLVEARVFDNNLTIDTGQHGDVLEAVFKEAALSNKKETAKLDALACILANLIISFWSDKPVRYSRGKGNYRLPKRYGKSWFTYTNIVRTIDQLEVVGLIEQRKGFRDFDGRSFLARMRPTQRLAELIGHCTVNNKPIQEPIHLKDAYKRLIDYEDTGFTSSIRERLIRYNELVDSTQMRLVIPANVELRQKSREILKQNYPWTSTITGILSSGEYKQQDLWVFQHNLSLGRVLLLPTPISLHHHKASTTIQEDYDHYLGKIFSEDAIYPLEYLQTYRVFNRCGFTAGGRFYNRGLRSYMGLSKELREFIWIDGQPVIELDYSGLHLRFAYHLKGRDYREDPYEFCSGDEVLRKACKLAALILINSGSRGSAVKAIRKAYLEDRIPMLKDEEINRLIDRLVREHAFIEEFFFSDMGVYFQMIDSRIMDGILAHFTRKYIPILPVHDSCIIARQHEDELRYVMIEEYRKVMGFDPLIK